MAHEEHQFAALGLRLCSDPLRLFEAQAEPVHSGVDVQRGSAMPARGDDEGLPLGKLGETADDRMQIASDVGGRSAGQHAVEDVDRRRRSG